MKNDEKRGQQKKPINSRGRIEHCIVEVHFEATFLKGLHLTEKEKMKINILNLLVGILTIFGCDNDDVHRDIDGQYIGTFQRGRNTSNVELTFTDTNFSGESETVKFPAICNGNYSISERTIKFENQCPWTAEFDWSLILTGTWNFSFANNTLILTNSIGDLYTLIKQE